MKLGKAVKHKPHVPPEVKAAQARVLRLHKLATKLATTISSTSEQVTEARQAVAAARADCRRIVNAFTKLACDERDSLTHSVLTSNPRKLYRSIRASNNKGSSKINTLNVGNKVYSGNSVPDGFFDSLSTLKSPDMTRIYSSPSYKSAASDYSTIRKI